MPARSQRLNLGGGLIVDTPLLVPSFSSKGFKALPQIVDTMSEFITDAVLVSSYDIHYKHVRPSELTFPVVVFLDSGGYEARVEHDLSEAYGRDHHPKPWTREMHADVLTRWPRSIARVIATFDSPRSRSRLTDQVRRGRQLQERFPGVPVELLVKPEKQKDGLVPLGALIRSARELRPFTTIGVTEKEIGDSFLERLENIVRLRRALDDAEVGAPIHIFGSLDAVTTPLYFIAGAEIFDGLTWLRFGYHEGVALYGENYSIARERDWLRRRKDDLVTVMWKNNYYYLQALRDKMATFAATQDFSLFGPVERAVREAAEALKIQRRGRN